jgi:diguanylate cyclase (GGDEF)-like protein
MDDRLLTALRTCTNLPSPPAVATRIIELSSSTSSTLGDVADAVSIDPALSAKLLRMANSPLYARQRKVDNLRQAITLFGIDGTLNIALSFSLKKSSQASKTSGLDYNTYWKRSLASALICQEFGKRLGESSKDSLFLLGLLQDIGVLALDKACPEIYHELSSSNDDLSFSHEQLCNREIDTLGTDHAEVGAWLLEEWNLPKAIISPIASSHIPLEDMPCEEVPAITKCVAASCIMADIFVTDSLESTYFNTLNKLEKIIPLERSQYKQIIEDVSENFIALASMFDIEITQPESLESLSDRAKEVLTLRNISNIHNADDKPKTPDDSEQKELSSSESERDILTGLYSHPYFDHCVKNEFEHSKKHQWPMSIVFIDIDDFSVLNDSHGHAVGNEVLKQVAKRINNCTRDTDILSRYGGEEFTVLLPGIDKHGTKIVCERMVDEFRKSPFKLSCGQEINITISAGAAVCYGEKYYKDWSQVINNADEAAYQAKHKGKNQYFIFEKEERLSTHLLLAAGHS